MLAVEGLGKRFGPKWIFRGLSFTLEPGQTLVVIGRNGSGKSTLLKTICGLVAPSEGKVSIPEGDPRLVLGVSTLEMSLYASLTVTEHLELSAKLRGCEAHTVELLTKVGLADAQKLFANQLSTGMKNRLKLAIAIQAEPKLLILDEPGAAMDEHGRLLLEEICKEQVTRGALILATNDPAERRFATHELELAS